MKLTKYLMSLTLAAAGVATFTSCDDMLDKGNSYVIYADDDHLTGSSDTVTSLVGILAKLQAIAVRTNLLGEVRADLVKVNDNAIVDLKDLANFEANVTNDDDANVYNNPRDYFAVINNCNYFLDRVNDSLPEIHTPGMNYMFERETAAVHTIRAWTYLQTVLVYGKVPFFDKPILTLADSKAEHPMYDLVQICDYFIEDLKPYVDIMLPEYTSFNGNNDIKPQMCFFPTNIVLADLYLWKAAVNHDSEAAKEAAKHYYDFIVWELNGKKRTVTGVVKSRWIERDLYDKIELESPSAGSFAYSTTAAWGAANTECLAAIAMDKTATTGYYNDLQNLYNADDDYDLKEASISPSDALKELSQAQSYVAFDTYRDTVEVTAANLSDEALEDYMLGDLRLSSVYSIREREYNEKEVELQTITKHRDNNVLVYRTQQLYLRLAEALNYAGYPRFAKQILTMGLSNIVIKNEVQPYYTSSQDSAFINYFDFNDSFFVPYAMGYSVTRDEYGLPIKYTPALLSSTIVGEELNTQGIHSRGSGLTFLNTNYLPALEVDSMYAPFPQEALDTIGEEPLLRDYVNTFPVKPSMTVKNPGKPKSWDQYPGVTVTYEEYVALGWGKLTEARVKNFYDSYIKKDSVGMYQAYLDALDIYNAQMDAYTADTAAIMNEYRDVLAKYDHRVEVYVEAWNEWHGAIYANPTFIEKEQVQVDQAILDEQALELCFEGNRYYDLMRRAYWYNDYRRLNDPISAARPEVAGKLLNKENWFLNYKGKIGWNAVYKY